MRKESLKGALLPASTSRCHLNVVAGGGVQIPACFEKKREEEKRRRRSEKKRRRGCRNPITTCLAHSLFFILVCYPELILSTIFMYLFVMGLSNYRVRPRGPPRSIYPNISPALWSHHDELDEEFDALPSSRPDDVVRARYDRLRSMAGWAQTMVGDLAMQVERVHGLIGWRDPRATGIFVWFALTMAFVMYLMSFQVMVLLWGFYLMRHPSFRNGRMPSIPANFFKRLPAKTDMLL